MSEEKAIPLYTKVGWVVSWTIMLIIMLMVGRNCIGSIKYGTTTDQDQIGYYYDLGHKDGKGGEESRLKELDLKNPLFTKAYSKGFREGLDVNTEKEKLKEEK